MPKINAPTVAEHRAAQREALLDSVGRLILTTPPLQITMTDVARDAGLSRTSAYDYFPSVGELLAALALETFPSWTADLNNAVARARTPETKIAAYVRVTLELVTSGGHRLATAVEERDVSAGTREKLTRLHAGLASSLEQVLATNSGDPHVTGSLVQGTLNAAMDLVERGTDASLVARATTNFLVRALVN